MYFTEDEWPGGKNLAASPKIWREMFSIIDSDYFGLTYDPSHLAWQRMDYIKPVYEFAPKIHNVHLKDTKFYQDKYDDVGIFAHPLEYHAPKLPGLGDIDWGRFISALTDTGFAQNAFIEVEDRSFEASQEDILDSIRLSASYMGQFIVRR
jgi:sugar phosphate isomerase/epimerase